VWDDVKPGDKVLCIDGASYNPFSGVLPKEGKIYTVRAAYPHRINPSEIMLHLEEIRLPLVGDVGEEYFEPGFSVVRFARVP
jgi:hypothetical protein